jgi:2-polyprenyl-3-methyl-5-hydroxy-6-metoxy-1,4-benzoquinol methylase
MQYYEGKGRIRYYESPAWGEWCRRVYGIDLKQIGTVTKGELELFFNEVCLLPDSHILDIGCGPGYISASIAKYYNSTVMGIDIDKYAIAHARKTFLDNPLLNFQVADGNEISLETSSFDLIYFFDTLYFTATAEKLRLLLDKCLSMLKTGGKLAIFWSSNPMDEARKPTLSNTQVGLWGINNNIPFKAFDLTESNKEFWRKAKIEILSMETELRREIPETYKQVLQECIHAEQNEEDIFRWLYIFTKQ